jgi:diguanylate cyclase (GGDEF)-like protein/PAS domain S-box-containing protein
MLVNIENLELFFEHLNILPFAIVVADISDGTIVAFNKEAEQLWMRDAREFIGKPQTVLHPPYWNEKGRETFSHDIAMLESGQIVQNTRNAILRSDGKEIAVEIKANMFLSGSKKYIVGIFNSIEKRVQAYALLEKKERELSEIFENTQIGILYLEDDFRVSKVNQRLVEIMGYDSKEELEGKSSEIFHKEERNYRVFIKKYEKLLSQHETVCLEYEVRKKNGELICVSLSGKAIDKATPADLSKGLIWLVEDVSEKYKILSELKENRTLLEYHTSHDFLTDLPNRTLFRDRVELIIEKSNRAKKKFALFVLDLDHFKQLNDSLGHDAGDTVLLEAVQRLKSSIRAEDTLARLGANEFSILFEDLHNMQDIMLLAKNLLEDFRRPFSVLDQDVFLSCSIGIAIYPEDAKSAENLLKFAENAMYRAKEEGRDNFQFYTQEMTKLAFERLMLESNIRQAIKNDEFCIYYQAQYDAKKEKVVGMEALIRWNNPQLGIISPAKFIPFAEESNLIIEIDNWMMEHAIAEVSRWKKSGLDVGVLSLNLAIRQLESEHFLKFLEDLLRKYDFNPKGLKLEILERDMMKKPTQNIQKLEALKAMNIAIALDDFGVGNSSLKYLNEFPIDQLKIDQSFIRGISHGDNTILLAIIALSLALNLQIVAEGVEDKEELDFLLEHGCSVIQGYYFYRPVSGEVYKTSVLQQKEQQQVSST